MKLACYALSLLHMIWIGVQVVSMVIILTTTAILLVYLLLFAPIAGIAQ